MNIIYSWYITALKRFLGYERLDWGQCASVCVCVCFCVIGCLYAGCTVNKQCGLRATEGQVSGMKELKTHLQLQDEPELQSGARLPCWVSLHSADYVKHTSLKSGVFFGEYFNTEIISNVAFYINTLS